MRVRCTYTIYHYIASHRIASHCITLHFLFSPIALRQIRPPNGVSDFPSAALTPLLSTPLSSPVLPPFTKITQMRKLTKQEHTRSALPVVRRQTSNVTPRGTEGAGQAKKNKPKPFFPTSFLSTYTHAHMNLSSFSSSSLLLLFFLNLLQI